MNISGTIQNINHDSSVINRKVNWTSCVCGIKLYSCWQVIGSALTSRAPPCAFQGTQCWAENGNQGSEPTHGKNNLNKCNVPRSYALSTPGVFVLVLPIQKNIRIICEKMKIKPMSTASYVKYRFQAVSVYIMRFCRVKTCVDVLAPVRCNESSVI